ncbi:MAG: hypothetical protein K2L42_06680 [Clostridia bacterium]|nr:hypothetical protein [Clostridia bacterium]
MNDKDKFEYSYTAPTKEERREIERIKNQYIVSEKKEDRLENLRKLNKKVNLPPMVIGLAAGIAGTLIMGLGMAMVMEWGVMVWGVTVGIAGAAVAAVAYPIYRAALNRNKRKYGKQIIDLSNELLNRQ